MGKINKYANLYKNGKLIRKAPLKNYTIQELEKLVDSLPEGKERDNAMYILMQMYQNPVSKEDKEYVLKMQTNLLNDLLKKSTEEQAEDKLKEVDDYVEFTESDEPYTEPNTEEKE